MKKLTIGIISIICFIFSIAALCNAQKQTAQAVDAKTLFEKKCSTCHGIDKPKSQKKTQAEWTDTVMRMKKKHGAPVNNEEEKTIIEHLAKNYGK